MTNDGTCPLGPDGVEVISVELGIPLLSLVTAAQIVRHCPGAGRSRSILTRGSVPVRAICRSPVVRPC